MTSARDPTDAMDWRLVTTRCRRLAACGAGRPGARAERAAPPTCATCHASAETVGPVRPIRSAAAPGSTPAAGRDGREPVPFGESGSRRHAARVRRRMPPLPPPDGLPELPLPLGAAAVRLAGIRDLPRTAAERRRRHLGRQRSRAGARRRRRRRTLPRRGDRRRRAWSLRRRRRRAITRALPRLALSLSRTHLGRLAPRESPRSSASTASRRRRSASSTRHTPIAPSAPRPEREVRDVDAVPPEHRARPRR